MGTNSNPPRLPWGPSELTGDGVGLQLMFPTTGDTVVVMEVGIR